jgi:hypothetical protein
VKGRLVNFQDQKLICKDCGKEFIWTAGEQEFYASKGLLNAPARCPSDRAARRQRADDADRVRANGDGRPGDLRAGRQGERPK